MQKFFYPLIFLVAAIATFAICLVVAGPEEETTPQASPASTTPKEPTPSKKQLPALKSIKDIPKKLGDWTAHINHLPPDIEKVMRLSEREARTYSYLNTHFLKIFFISTKRESLDVLDSFSPATAYWNCGWDCKASDRKELLLSDGTSFSPMVLLLERKTRNPYGKPHKACILFWFQFGDFVIVDEKGLKKAQEYYRQKKEWPSVYRFMFHMDVIEDLHKMEHICDLATRTYEHTRTLRETKPIEPVTKPEFTNSIGMKFERIPTGRFMMGAPEKEKHRNNNEGPVHEVRIGKPFYMGIHEVTQEAFVKVMSEAPWDKAEYVQNGKGYPAYYVTWDEAVQFCRKLSAREGRLYRLPTEAEWEYACRAGSKTAYHFGDDSNDLGKYAWWGAIFGNGNCENEPYPHHVGQKLPNAWGLYDMHGNVNEWCSDWYDKDYYRTYPETDPTGPATGSKRVSRGGGWDDNAQSCRCAFRFPADPDFPLNYLGFRVVLETPE